MDRHFACTACGKCCHGMLPLSIADALAHADTFPLVILWSSVRQGGRSFAVTADLGITVRLKNRKQAAIRITPTAYVPPAFACPQLKEDGLCGIHETKPQRCRTMPFSGARDQADQDDLLIPRAGWLCDTSPEAPLVYRDRKITAWDAFAAERDVLSRDAAVLKPYAAWLMDSSPQLSMQVQKAAMRPAGGQVVVAFSTLIPRLPKTDIYEIAARQAPVMKAFADRTEGDPALAEFHRIYVEGWQEWRKIALCQP